MKPGSSTPAPSKLCQYKLSTGISEVKKQPHFRSVREAWEGLRKVFVRPRYATLYRKETVNVPIVNRTSCVKRYNSKYTTQKIGDKNIHTYWVPVLFGDTSHSYRAVK